MAELYLKALAKINLGLDVLGRREDGYHEVRMVMQTIHLYDQVRICTGSETGIQVKTNLYYLPVNENNLVYKAAQLLMDEFGITSGISIDLKKYIPVAAGMAGGSSDAASVLYGMNRMFRLGLSMEELMERGVKLGADVPYCLMRGTALAEGIGEVLTPLAAPPKCWVLVAKPSISVSTKWVYQNLKLDHDTEHPDIDGLIAALETGDLDAMAASMGNVLEPVTRGRYPIIGQIEEQMEAYGALKAMMSGSGPTVFGLFTQKGKAHAAMTAIRKQGLAKQVYLTTMHHNGRR